MSQIFGHRGFSGEYPENTMLAFEKAIEARADGIELDVHLTKDNQLVIIHDEDIERTCNGKGLVRDMTFESLRSFDASYKFTEFGKNKIPSLEEYFDFIKATGATTNIELKTGVFEYPGIEEKVIDLIQKYGLEEKIILSSFNHESVLRCRKINPKIKTGFLTESWIINFAKYTADLNVDCCHPIHFYLRKDVVDEIHSKGLIINTWTVNEEEDILRLSGFGVDTLIGNYPDRMVRLLRK